MMSPKFVTSLCTVVEALFKNIAITGENYTKGTALFLLKQHQKKESKVYKDVNIETEAKRLENLENALAAKSRTTVIQELEKLKKQNQLWEVLFYAWVTGRIYGNTIKKLKQSS